MTNTPPLLVALLRSRLILVILLLIPGACGDEALPGGNEVIFEVGQGACMPGCDIDYEFLTLVKTSQVGNKFCVLRAEKATFAEGLQEATMEEVNPEGQDSLAVAVRATCVNAPFCTVCSAIKIIHFPLEEKYHLTLLPVLACFPTDEILVNPVLTNCQSDSF